MNCMLYTENSRGNNCHEPFLLRFSVNYNEQCAWHPTFGSVANIHGS